MQTKPVIFLVFANDRDDHVRYLRNLPEESRRLRQQLKEVENRGLCEVVERTNATATDVFSVFQSPEYRNRVAVFHYGGHANGHSLLFESNEGAAAAAHAEGLARFLGTQTGLQLVFLNGCSTMRQVTGLLDAGVPAVIATSRAIDDRVATEFSETFYRGLAGGGDIVTAYRQAEAVTITTGGTNTRAFYLGSEKAEDAAADEQLLNHDQFPWELHIREGAEIKQEWNLPEAAGEPLFGLPDPPFQDLPAAPFRNLKWFRREHADVFFGRGREIRELYEKVTKTVSPPVILYYGQSGVGKSSLLHAGLLPRLESECDVRYVRRDAQTGLAAAFNHELTGENSDPGDLRNAWKQCEQTSGRPLVIIIDQLEEVFTNPREEEPDELPDFLTMLHDIFCDPGDRPQGKLIAAFRKEWLAEFENQIAGFTIPFSKVFLDRMDRNGVVRAVAGATRSERCHEQYRLTIESGLAEIIADDLLEDPATPVSPTLQVLLTRMWDAAREENGESPHFHIELYRELRRSGILLKDFLRQQIDEIQRRLPQPVESGLLLDYLSRHTTDMGTSRKCTPDEIDQSYVHQAEPISRLRRLCIDCYLLTVPASGKSMDQAGTILAHDTLAPVVRDATATSEYSGQRARRSLDARLREWLSSERTMFLDESSLALVENGRDGTAQFSEIEQEFLSASRARIESLKPPQLTHELLPAELNVRHFEPNQRLDVLTADIGHQALTFIDTSAFKVIFLSFAIVIAALGSVAQIVIGSWLVVLAARGDLLADWQLVINLAAAFLGLTALNLVVWFAFFHKLCIRFDIAKKRSYLLERTGAISAPIDFLQYGIETDDDTRNEVIAVDHCVLIRRPLGQSGETVDDKLEQFYASLCHAVGRPEDRSLKTGPPVLWPIVPMVALFLGISSVSLLTAPIALLWALFGVARLQMGVDKRGWHPVLWCLVSATAAILVVAVGATKLLPMTAVLIAVIPVAVAQAIWLREIVKQYTESPVRMRHSLLYSILFKPLVDRFVR